MRNAGTKVRMYVVLAGLAFALLPAPALEAQGGRNERAGVVFETVGKGKRWPVADATTPYDGFVTVVAITPSANRFAVQVLWPRTPADSGWMKAGKFQRLRFFEDSAVSHRVAAAGQALQPLVVGLFSEQRPDLSRLQRGGAWATDIVIDTPIDSTTDLVEVLGAAVFGRPNADFAANLYRETAPVRYGQGEAARTPPSPSNGKQCAAGSAVNCAGFLTPEDPGYRWAQSIEAAKEAEYQRRKRAAEQQKKPGG